MEREWKPDTIVVEMSPACPRCGSSNTKFCYYNNYSLTQPRYFCKACRRYWTKGGSLRNVPVGGGCRKSRRGKSIRGPAARVPSRQGIEPSTKSNSPSTSYPSASPAIDLAAVYANFLNQNQTPQVENRIIDEPRCQIANSSPSGFPDFQGLDLSQINNHPPQLSTAGLNFLDHDFTETRLFEDNGNAIYYQRFDDFKFNSQKQLAGANDGEDDNNCTSVVFNSMENNEALAALPPLPGEEMVAPAEILWADEILPPSGSFAGSVGAGPGANDEVVGEEVSPFSALSLEAIFRS